MSVAFFARSQFKRQSAGTGTITVPYHTGQAVGDLQILVVSAFSSNAWYGAPSGSGWSSLLQRQTSPNNWSGVAIYTRILTAPDLTANISVPAADYTNVVLRTYRPSSPGRAHFTLVSSGEGLVAAAAAAEAILIRIWTEAQQNTFGGSAKAINAPAGLLNSNTPAAYNWYDSGLVGDDPVANGAAGTATATHSGGSETTVAQWVNVNIVDDDTAFPMLQLATSVIELPNVQTIFPQLAQDVEVSDPYNQLVMSFPKLSVDMTGNPRDTILTTVFPSLSLAGSVTGMPIPDFDVLVRQLDPAVWWRFDAGDFRELFVGGDLDDYTHMIDASGHGYDAAMSHYSVIFPPGMVLDSLDTEYKSDPAVGGVLYGRSTNLYQSWDPAVDPPGYLYSQEFSVFVLADYAGGYFYYEHEVFGRTGLWRLSKLYGSWVLEGGMSFYPYYWQLGFNDPAADDYTAHVDSVGFTAKVGIDAYGNPTTFIQLYLNGRPCNGVQTPYYGSNIEANDGYENKNPNNLLDVGFQGGWLGGVQHALYFKRALSDGDFDALHKAARISRPQKNKATTFFPALEVAGDITQQNRGAIDTTFPSLSVGMYSYEGSRTPAGGLGYLDAAPLTRGLMSAPSPRSTYPIYGDPVDPYFSAWFKWTADTTDQVWFSTMRSLHEQGADPMDTVMVGYVLADGALVQFAYADDVDNFTTSQLVIDNPVIDETYYIRVGTFDDSGSGVAAYVIDNDLVPMPTLADLIVIGGYQSPSGYIGGEDGPLPTAVTNSVSAPTSIPPGQQAWWLWTAETTGTVSFDALLSQQWLTNGTGTEGPAVDISLWTDGDFLAYSEEHGTVDFVVPQGQITWDVTAGQTYHIKLHSNYSNPGPVNGLIRISTIAVGAIVIPDPKTIYVNATPNDGPGYDPSGTGLLIPMASEAGDGGLSVFTPTNGSVVKQRGFYGSYDLSRSFGGTPPQLDTNNALTCIWNHARCGRSGGQWWSIHGDGSGINQGSWNGTDPYDGSVLGYGACASPWYAQASVSDNNNSGGVAGARFHSTWDDVVFLYADAIIEVYGAHYQVNISGVIQAIRDRSDVRDDASLVSIGMMADEPSTFQPNHQTWYANTTRPHGYKDQFAGAIQWGPDPTGDWWSSGSSDAEPGMWMQHPIATGVSPRGAGGRWVSGVWTPYASPDEWWTPLDPTLLGAALAYEADPTNAGVGGLTLAYLPQEVALPSPPYQLYAGFGYTTASADTYAYYHRMLMAVTVQEAAYAGPGDPLGADGLGFPRVGDFALGAFPDVEWPDVLDPGDFTEQILFGPYPIEFTPVMDVLVFGPRHKPINWPSMELAFDFDTELRTHDPGPVTDPLMPPMGSVRFQVPEFTLVQGVPVASKAVGKIAFASETLTPHLSTQLYAIAHAVSLGEDVRMTPYFASQTQVITTSYRRQPTDPVETRQEVEALAIYDGSGSGGYAMYAPHYFYNDETRQVGPERVSSYAYWRGNPAATTALSFRPGNLKEEALTTYNDSWLTNSPEQETTILISAVLNDQAITGGISPIFTTQAEDGTPGVGLFFNRQSELLWWDYRHDITDPAKRILGKLQLLDDIRKVSQPVLVGARINNVTGKVTLVAADSRLRTVETSMVDLIPAGHKLVLGDAGPLTSPGAYDVLDMRWWVRGLSDAELLSAAAAMADLWGVML